eukprot:14782865-Ditylum_brightwellii.AAC.1
MSASVVIARNKRGGACQSAHYQYAICNNHVSVVNFGNQPLDPYEFHWLVILMMVSRWMLNNEVPLYQSQSQALVVL